MRWLHHTAWDTSHGAPRHMRGVEGRVNRTAQSLQTPATDAGLRRAVPIGALTGRRAPRHRRASGSLSSLRDVGEHCRQCFSSDRQYGRPTEEGKVAVVEGWLHIVFWGYTRGKYLGIEDNSSSKSWVLGGGACGRWWVQGRQTPPNFFNPG